MATTEIKNALATVRFHDEYCVKEEAGELDRINRIVSAAYQRRMASQQPWAAPPVRGQ